MYPLFRLHSPITIVTLLLAALSAFPARAQNGSLTTVDNPGGGQIVYGLVPNQSSPQGAMAVALRYAHGSFGDRPQVGAIFESKDGQTFGASFTLTAVKLGNQPIAGLVMVSVSNGTQLRAAVLYDEKSRFRKTQPEMLRTLSSLWSQPVAVTSGDASEAASSTRIAGPQPLRMQTAGDHSAKLGLPADWHLTGVAAGSITAEGPHGEKVALAILYQNIHDPHLKSNLQQFSGANASDAIAYPIGGNVFNAYASLTNQLRRIHHQPPATFTYISSSKLASTQTSSSTFFTYDVDLQDGKGLRRATARVIENYYANSPTWMMSVDCSSIPKSYVEAEQTTVQAIVNSFGQDQAVLNSELATVQEDIHATGVRAAHQAADADARRIASTQAFNQHMDDLSIASKVQQNYTMDCTELQDSYRSARGAIDNNVAAALVRANPDRYQEVSAQDFLKGIDY